MYYDDRIEQFVATCPNCEKEIGLDQQASSGWLTCEDKSYPDEACGTRFYVENPFRTHGQTPKARLIHHLFQYEAGACERKKKEFPATYKQVKYLADLLFKKHNIVWNPPKDMDARDYQYTDEMAAVNRLCNKRDELDVGAPLTVQKASAQIEELLTANA